MKKLSLVAVMFILLSTLGCSCNSTVKTQSPPYFPVQKEAPQAYLLALLPGELVLDNGYLRVNGELIIWPYGYSVKIEGKNIYIIDEKGRQVCKVGDMVKIGGGQIPAYYIEEIIGQPLPPDCKGPYWMAANIAE
jgi:hypothetical protein